MPQVWCGVRRNQGRGRYDDLLRRAGAAEVTALENSHARSTCEIVEPTRTKVSVRSLRHDGALHQGRPGRRPVPRRRDGGAAAAQAPLFRLVRSGLHSPSLPCAMAQWSWSEGRSQECQGAVRKPPLSCVTLASTPLDRDCARRPVLLVSVIGAAHQRAGGDVPEAHRFAKLP